MDKIKTAVCAEVADEYRELLDRIPVGKQQAISMRVLADSFGMDISELKDYVLQARIDGCFIVSGQHGYFLPETQEELQKYVIHRKTVIKTAQKAIMHFQNELSLLNQKGDVMA